MYEFSENFVKNRFAVFSNFLHFPNAAGLAAVFLLVFCICCGCSLSVSGNAVPKPAGLLSRAFIELFEDKNQATRMEAYFLSVGLPDMPKLEQILRRRQAKADTHERVVALYALAAMTREHQDIDAFLDIFPNEPQLFTDIMEAEWTLSGTFNAGIADFLLLLAYEQRTRERALPHLARIIRNMPGELESMNKYFKDALVRAYIDKHWDDAMLDFTLCNKDTLREFYSTGKCAEKIGYLIQNGDHASKVTAILMTHRMWIPDNLMEIIKFHKPQTFSMYSDIQNFYRELDPYDNLLSAGRDTIVSMLHAEKRLYSPPLRGIVGTLWQAHFSDEKNRAQILKILSEIRQYGKDCLEICEVERLNRL